jgi:hypothetical protein
MYEHSHDPWKWNVKEELKEDQLFSNFCHAVIQRITKDDLNVVKSYKGIVNLKENFHMRSTNNGNREFSKLWPWLNQQINSGVYNKYMTTKDFLSDEYIEVLENYIDKYILPYGKKLKLKKYVEPVVENTIVEEPEVEELVIEKVKSNAGRPKGSKNKKQAKEIFMPTYRVGTIDGNVDIDSFVKAIADLVWRKEGQIDSFYIHNLILSDSHKKYINYLFMKKQSALENKYWKIVKKGKANILMPKMRRSGYYGCAQCKYDLFSLTYIAEMSNISKDTLFYRLKHMSIKEATKNPGE